MLKFLEYNFDSFEQYFKDCKRWAREYWEEVAIDKYSLDDEYADQPQYYIKWSDRFALSRWVKAMASKDYDDAVSKAQLKVRKHPGKYDLDDEPKEKAINAVVNKQKEVREARDNFINACYWRNRFKGVEKGFLQRKALLLGEGTLWEKQYYSQTEYKKQRTASRRKATGSRRSKRKTL